MISIKSYNYSKLVLIYGPNRGATVTVQWSTNDKAFKLIFGKSKYYLLFYINYTFSDLYDSLSICGNIIESY